MATPKSSEEEVVIEAHSLRQLATAVLERLGGKKNVSLRVQGSFAGEKRETGLSVWAGRGSLRAGEAVWPSRDALVWRYESAEALREAERKTPTLRLSIYATRGTTTEEREAATVENSEILGSLAIEVNELRKTPQTPRWIKLTGSGAPGELLLLGRSGPVQEKEVLAIRKEGSRKKPSPESSGVEEIKQEDTQVKKMSIHVETAEMQSPPVALPAKRLGSGSTLFELCVSLERAGSLAAVVGKELEEHSFQGRRMFWFSYELFGVVLQTEQFMAKSLDAPNFKIECDWFRLQGSAHEIAQRLTKPVEVFLCTDGIVAAAGALILAPLLPLDFWHPARASDTFFASEARFRLRVESRRPAAVFATRGESPQPGFLDVFTKLRRFGVSDQDAVIKRGPRGYPDPISNSHYETESFHDETSHTLGSPHTAATQQASPLDTIYTSRLSNAVRARWRLSIELLHASHLPDGVGYRIAYRAPALGQKREAKTARFDVVNASEGTPVKLAGGGALALFDFFKLSAADLDQLFNDRISSLVLELRSGSNDELLARASLPLAAPFYHGAATRCYEPKPPRCLRRSLESDFAIVPAAGAMENLALKAPAALRARLIIDEYLDENDDDNEEEQDNFSWGEGVADRLVAEVGNVFEDDIDDEDAQGVAGGNVAPGRRGKKPKKPPIKFCPHCNAPSDWEQRASIEATEKEREAWEAWRREEEAAWAMRLRRKEAIRMRKLEETQEAARRTEREEAAAHRAEYARLEAKLRSSLKDVEVRERALADAEASLKRERSVRVSELQLLEKRLRDEARHAVEAEKRNSKQLTNTLAARNAAIERAERRALAAEADFDRWRAAHRRTPEAELTNKLARARGQCAELQSRLDRARAETAEAIADRERHRGHVHRLARALQRTKDELHDKARRDLDELRLDFRAREQRFVLDQDYNALQSIKRELDDLRRLSRPDTHRAVPSTSHKQSMSPTKRTIPAHQEENNNSGTVTPPQKSNDLDDEAIHLLNQADLGYEGGAPPNTQTQLENLLNERRVLVEQAGYPLDDPVVLDLDRLIAAAQENSSSSLTSSSLPLGT